MLALSPPARFPLDSRTLALVAFTVVAWASAFPAIRAALRDFTPIELGAMRFAVAAAPAALSLLITRPALPRLAQAWRFAVGGIFFVAFYTVLINLGEVTVSAGAAAFIVNTAPIMAAVLALIFLRERFSLWGWVGTAVSFAGIGLIALGEGGGVELNRGTLMILGAAACAATATVVQKPLFAHHHALTVSAWNMVLGTLCLTPWLPGAFSQAASASSGGIVAVVYLGLVPGLLGYAAWSAVLSKLPASRAINFMYCVPPTATVMGLIFLGEVPTPLGLAGGVLALLGVVVVNLKR